MERTKRTHWRWVGVLAALLVPPIATAALTLPNIFTAGTVIKAADVNANFNAVRDHANTVETQLATLQAAVAAHPNVIGLARVAGTTISGFGGNGTTGVTVSGTGFPYTVIFSGSYPSTISAAKIIVQATAESASSGVANAIVNTASATSINVDLYVWTPPSTPLPGNPAFLTLTLGK